jgi:hypothetical protein
VLRFRAPSASVVKVGVAGGGSPREGVGFAASIAEQSCAERSEVNFHVHNRPHQTPRFVSVFVYQRTSRHIGALKADLVPRVDRHQRGRDGVLLLERPWRPRRRHVRVPAVRPPAAYHFGARGTMSRRHVAQPQSRAHTGRAGRTDRLATHPIRCGRGGEPCSATCRWCIARCACGYQRCAWSV